MQSRLLVVAIACFIPGLAPVAMATTPAAASTTATATTTAKYESPFEAPWDDDRQEGFLHMEHVNLAVPGHGPAKQLYYDILGFVPDTRRAHNIDKGSGTLWANMGTTQIHLCQGEPQVLPGTIGLVYPHLPEVLSRLKEANRGELEGTKFAWRATGGATIDVTCPYGNVFRLHERTRATPPVTGETLAPLDSRGGRLPSPSGPSLGLGIAYAHFRVRFGASAGIARFYREIFGAEAKEIPGMVGFEDATCSAAGGADSKAPAAAEAAGAGRAVVVRVGPVQHLAFVESEEALPDYDGHHICLYLTEEGFRRSFLEAERRGLVFVNPRPTFGNADTLEKALEEKQFRVKDMVDPSTGDLLHILEHEIRTVSHPSYPVGRDVPI